MSFLCKRPTERERVLCTCNSTIQASLEAFVLYVAAASSSASMLI